MRLARVLGAIGRALISAGVIVLLFVGYQLWGTGLQHSQAQDSLEDDFLSVLDSDLAQEAQAINEIVRGDAPANDADNDAPASEDGAAPTDDATADEAETETDSDTADDEAQDNATLVETNLDDIEYSPEFLSVLYPEPGKSLARIVIPDINVDQIVVEGVSVEDLRKGPGHYPSTPNPGQAGNASIAGHRTTYGAPFHRVDELKPGAQIIVQTIQGSFEYRVTANDNPNGGEPLGHFIVSPSDTWVLNQDDRNLLTLTACHPKYSARQRIIVQAELVGEPAPTIPRDEADELPPVQLDAGAEDESRGQVADGSDIDQIIGDDVARDDDPDLTDDPAFNDDETEVASGTDAVDGGDGDTGAAESSEASGASDSAEASAPTEPDTDSTSDDVETVAADVDTEAAAVDVSGGDAELTDSQTPFSTDFGEGLNGDRSKIKPAIMWGLAGGSIWLAAWFIGRRLERKWTLYAVGLIAFAPVLWSCFVNIDQALPSY